jgi:hypothetical protein
MEISQFRYEFVLIAHVPVVMALLPEGTGSHRHSMQLFGEGQLEMVQGIGQRALFGLTHQQVNVFGHHYESVDT